MAGPSEALEQKDIHIKEEYEQIILSFKNKQLKELFEAYLNSQYYSTTTKGESDGPVAESKGEDGDDENAKIQASTLCTEEERSGEEGLHVTLKAGADEKKFSFLVLDDFLSKVKVSVDWGTIVSTEGINVLYGKKEENKDVTFCENLNFDKDPYRLILNLISSLKTPQLSFSAAQEKTTALDQCTTLKQVCFAACVRRGYSLFSSSTATAEELAHRLNTMKEFSALKEMIRPDGDYVRIRDLRAYARTGKCSQSTGFYFNEDDKENERHFLLSRNRHRRTSKGPMQLFYDALPTLNGPTLNGSGRDSESRGEAAEL